MTLDDQSGKPATVFEFGERDDRKESDSSLEKSWKRAR